MPSARGRRGHGGGGDGHGGGGHDGAGSMRWLLTYADMITLLMVFFIVMYAMSNLDRSRYIQFVQSLRASLLNANVSNSVLDASRIPAPTQDLLPGTAGNDLNRQQPLSGLPFENSELADMQQIGMALAKALQEAGLAGQVNITVAERGLVISFADSVFFVKGVAAMKPESRAILDRIAPILKPLPNKLVVEGHTDNLKNLLPQYPTSWELSVDRAVAVARYLTEKGGIPPARIAATGYGEWRPRFPNDSEANRARNRRVDIVLLREVLSGADKVLESITAPAAGGAGR